MTRSQAIREAKRLIWAESTADQDQGRRRVRVRVIDRFGAQMFGISEPCSSRALCRYAHPREAYRFARREVARRRRELVAQLVGGAR